MKTAVSHDQNFKNQILDYPIEAIRFYAPEEAQALEQNPKILPIRQEQLKEQLGDSFRALDTSILLCGLMIPDTSVGGKIATLSERSSGIQAGHRRTARYPEPSE